VSQGFDISNVLYQTANLSRLVDNLAERMTEYMRSINSTRITMPGEALRQETYIRARWPWFILPAGLVVCTAFVLQATILTNRARRGPVWKSSSLPYLFHPIDGITPAELQDLERLSEMETGAQKMSARLGRLEDERLKLLVS
jgi:hypothetical protein